MGAAVFAFSLFSVGAFFFLQLSGGKTFFFFGKFDIWFLLFVQDCHGREQNLALLIQVNGIFD